MSEEQQGNTQQAEGNSETNPSTQADKNDVPYNRFQEVNQKMRNFESELLKEREISAKLKATQEEARQTSLKEKEEYKTLYNEGESKWSKTEERNKVLEADLSSYRENLVNQVAEERRYITDGMSIPNLQKFVQEEQVAVNAVKTDSSRAGTSAKGEFGGYDSKMEWVTKDAEGYEKAKNQTTGDKFGNIFTPQANPYADK